MLIVFEGHDGSGKSTVAARVTERLNSSGAQSVMVAEFSDTVFGEAMRKTLSKSRFLSLGSAIEAVVAQTLLVAGDLQLQDSVEIAPFLENGSLVLKDRHKDSLFACQLPKLETAAPGVSRATWSAWLEGLLKYVRDPDIVIFLECGDEVLNARLRARDNQDLREDKAVREARGVIYRQRMTVEGRNVYVISNDGDFETVIDAVVEYIIATVAEPREAK